jgi:hypothetical protein
MSYWNSKVLCIAVVSGIALGSVSQARAQAPANDICANATLITDSTVVQTISYNTTNAAYEGAPASCGCTSSRDVWFRYVPTTSGTVSISTQGLATWDTSIIVYSGTCFSLTNVACNDDTGSLQSVVTPTVVAGTSYLIRLSGCGSGSSAIRFTGPTTILPADTTAVTFQGQLKDDTGTPLNGTFNLQCLVMNNRAGTVLGSLIGVGGGFLIVPAIYAYRNTTMSAAIASTFVVITLNSASGLAVSYSELNNLNFSILIPFLALAVVGVVVGTLLSKKWSDAILRKSFVVLLLAVGTYMLTKEIIEIL